MCASVAFGLEMKSRPRGQLATTHATPFAGRERPEGHRRYPLRRYDGNEDLALDAYAGAEGNVDRWIAGTHATAR
jgi:hypothetical protein